MKKIISASVMTVLIITAHASAQEPKLLATLQGHTDLVKAVAFSPDGKLIASGSQDKSVKFWAVSSHKLIDSLFDNSSEVRSVRSIAFSPDGESLAISTGKVIYLLEVGTRKVIGALESSETGNWTLAFSPGGKTLAVTGFGGWIRLWD